MGRVDLKEQLKVMLEDAKVEIRKFSKKSYESQFSAMCEQYAPLFREIDELFYQENEDAELLNDLAKTFAEHASTQISEMKKSKRGMAVVDYNMSMVSFIFPMMDRQRTRTMELLAEQCELTWNQTFPKNKIGKASYDTIQGGFKSKLCYITTAVCESMNKVDDCYELTLLREYRDGYLLHDIEEGASIVKHYYDIAPTIVNRINKEEDSEVIYQAIWEEYLAPCVRLIEEDKNSETKELYSDMVQHLADKYLY